MQVRPLYFIKVISKIILGVEGVMLAPMSIGGVLFATKLLIDSSLLPLDFIMTISTLCFLISGWRVFFWVISNGPESGRKINRLWLTFSAMGVIVCMMMYFLIQQGTPNIGGTGAGLLLNGVFFIPTAMHLVIEILWQKHTATK